MKMKENQKNKTGKFKEFQNFFEIFDLGDKKTIFEDYFPKNMNFNFLFRFKQIRF